MNNLSLNELVGLYPGCQQILERYRIDYCCGGKQTLEQACTKKGLDSETVAEQIRNFVPHDQQMDLGKWPADLIVSYIEKKHHRYVEENLVLINQKLDQLVERHGENHAFLFELNGLFKQLSANLSTHMKKEELILFPYINNLVKASISGTVPQTPIFMRAANPISMMEAEHQEEGARLEKIAQLTNNYTPPEYACGTWQFVYEKLNEFEKDLHMHIYIENSILFPKAISLEQQLITS